MSELPLDPISIVWNGDMMRAAATGVVGGIMAVILLPGGPAATVGLFAAGAVLGWVTAASAITYLCGLSAVMARPPGVLSDFHALSRFPIHIDIGNGSNRWPALFVTVEIATSSANRELPGPPQFIARLSPGETRRCLWYITARARGLFELTEIRVNACFPGSLIGWRGTAPMARRLIALPTIYQLDLQVLELLKGLRLATGRLQATSSAAEEFIGVRVYRPGDNPRYIHPALSTRLSDYPNQFVLREYEDPTADDVCVVLDNVMTPGEERELELRYRREKAISFAVALCRLLCERQYKVRFRAHDGKGGDMTLTLQWPTRDVPRLESCLARLDPCLARANVTGMIYQEARLSNAAILLVSLRDDRIEERNPRLPVATLTPNMQIALVHKVIGA